MANLAMAGAKDREARNSVIVNGDSDEKTGEGDLTATNTITI